MTDPPAREDLDSAPLPTPAAATAPTAPVPPDPAEYDTERNAAARARGLSAPYIAGGRDPDPEPARREERFLVRILIVMVAAIVLGGFVLGVLANLIRASGT
jgi:hypothetical protein